MKWLCLALLALNCCRSQGPDTPIVQEVRRAVAVTLPLFLPMLFATGFLITALLQDKLPWNAAAHFARSAMRIRQKERFARLPRICGRRKPPGTMKRFNRLLVFGLVALPLMAQAPSSDVSTMIRQFQAATIPWLTTGEQVASGLFGILAAIEFGITFGMLALAQADITIWGATVARKFMAVGAFYALLLLGPGLMQTIIDSYVRFGSMASGVPSITAGDIFADGIDIAGSLLITAVGAGITLSILTSLLMVLCALIIGWSFVKLVKGFVMAKIESFITIYAAVIQLGWGASRFTSIYAERYVAAAMATGVKLMVFYFIVGVERLLAPTWINTASQVTVLIGGIIPTLTLTGSIVLFCALAEPEKLAANIFAGQPQFTGHDITNTYMPYVNAGIGVASSAVGLAAGFASSGILAAPAAAGFSAAASSGARAASSTIINVTSQRPQSAPPPRPSAPQRLLPPPKD